MLTYSINEALQQMETGRTVSVVGFERTFRMVGVSKDIYDDKGRLMTKYIKRLPDDARFIVVDTIREDLTEKYKREIDKLVEKASVTFDEMKKDGLFLKHRCINWYLLI